jgi:hypothetical protein
MLRYRTRRVLATRARRATFSVQIQGAALVVTPATGRPRRITESDWERSLPLLDHANRGPLQEASFNSSYIEALVDDLRGS